MSPRNPRRRWGSRSGPARILVVDDLDASRYITASWLRRSGHVVDEAITGRAALTALGENEFDLVMLDVHLPDMSGFEVCEIIKADPATAALPVIHVSATYVEPEDKTVGLTRGADAYLTEPVDPGELLATVEAALRYYRARMLAEQLADRHQADQGHAVDQLGRRVRRAGRRRRGRGGRRARHRRGRDAGHRLRRPGGHHR